MAWMLWRVAGSIRVSVQIYRPPVPEVAAGVVIHAAKIGAPGVQVRWVSRSSVLPEFVAYIRPSRFSGWTAGCSCPKA